jgi:UDP:flavonoid glycosyltransferase YjiC (YdhE family)
MVRRRRTGHPHRSGYLSFQPGDVLDRLISGVRRIIPDARIAVGAGDSRPQLLHHADSRIRISDFIPQSALLPEVDLAIHHGGVSSFTESLHAGKPAVVLPFSSDQFDVASDVERWKLGTVIDPNRFTHRDLERAIHTALSSEILRSVSKISLELQQRGPEWTARRLYET